MSRTTLAEQIATNVAKDIQDLPQRRAIGVLEDVIEELNRLLRVLYKENGDG